MIQQSSALRRLEEVLTIAVANGERTHASGPILLEAMKLSSESRNILDFYELLNKVEEEAKSIRNKQNIDRYIQSIEKLHQVFVDNHTWGAPWNIFATYIEDKDVLNILDALADFFYSQNPTIFLEQEFLENLNREFNSLLDEIISSELSKELKRFLVERIADILTAIRRYHIDGTKGLEKAIKSFVSDLVISGHSLNNEVKKFSISRKCVSYITSLYFLITPIISIVPDIHGFWVPQYEKLVEDSKKIERIIDDSSTFQEVFEKASCIFTKQPQNMIAGREQRSLPAPKEESETAID